MAAAHVFGISYRRLGLTKPDTAVRWCTVHMPVLHSFSVSTQVLDKRHKHELLPSAAPFHVTRAATSAEAAREAAKALHVTEAQDGDGVPYDDDDLG